MRSFQAIGRLGVLAVALAFAAVSPAAQTVLHSDDEQFQPDALDITAAIREHFRLILPVGWWVTDPERRPLGYQVVVHIPDNWRGNPTAAVMNFCPGRDSRIWEQADSLAIQAFYKDLPWPGFDCLRP